MSAQSVIGVDLGGTKIAVARYRTDTWEMEAEERTETNAHESFSRVLETMVQMILALKTPETIGIGVGVPGLVAQPDGIVLRLPNIPGSEQIPLKKLLGDACKLPVALENDGNAFALAEASQGKGKGRDIVVGITIGTGVGGGIIHGGKIFRGHHGFAAEIGHMLLMPGHPPYETDDRRGDVEQFFSGTALGKRCSAAGSPSDYLQGDACAFLFKDLTREIAWMCASLAHLLDPAIIILGGSTGRALAPHLDAIVNELPRWLLPGTPPPEIAIGTLKDAGTRGAAMLGREMR